MNNMTDATGCTNDWIKLEDTVIKEEDIQLAIPCATSLNEIEDCKMVLPYNPSEPEQSCIIIKEEMSDGNKILETTVHKKEYTMNIKSEKGSYINKPLKVEKEELPLYFIPMVTLLKSDQTKDTQSDLHNISNFKNSVFDDLLEHFQKDVQDKKHVCDISNYWHPSTDDSTFKYEVNLDDESDLTNTTRNTRRINSSNIKKSFSKSSVLLGSEKTCVGKNMFNCDICNKCFSRSFDLTSHKRVHTGEKPYTCNICNKSFSQSCHLKRHKRIHTGEKPYTCNMCNKSFSHSNQLTLHKRINMDEKQYTCNICNKICICPSALTIHKRIHTGEKPYACNVCNKCFSQSSALVLHKRIHTGEKPYTCKICNKSFKTSSGLTVHNRVHTGEKPFTCKICKKSFKISSGLTVHKRVHTGEKPYNCNMCNKFFSQSSQLMQHKRIHKGPP